MVVPEIVQAPRVVRDDASISFKKAQSQAVAATVNEHLVRLQEMTAALAAKAPVDADYLVRTANGTLTAERAVTDTATVAWDWATAGQAKANVPDASIGTVKLGGDITTAGKALLDDANASAQRTTLGLGALAVLGTVGTSQLDDDAVTYAKLQNLAAASKLLGRGSAGGAGNAEEITLGSGLSMSGTTLSVSNPPIDADAITDSMMRDSAALSVIGRAANSAGDPADIAASSDGVVLRRSGTTLGFGKIETAGITDATVTYAKIQNVSATDKLLGRSTAGAGAVEEIACTPAARSVLDDATVAAMVDTLGGASSTGTGGLARATSPAFVTPNLGTPSAINLANATNLLLGVAWSPSNESVYFTDWQETNSKWASVVGSSGAAYSTAGSSGHPGVLRVSSGATAGGYVTTYDSASSTTLWNATTWETVVYLSGTWTSGGKVRIGFSNGTATTDPSNGVFFEYDQALSANWRIRCGNAGTYTTTTSSTAVAFSAWLKLKITWDGTTVTFYVNGTSIGTITTNVPTAVLAQSYFAYGNVTNAYATCDVDYTFLRQSGLAR
ncbi:MAG: hypothetical protein WAT39_24065 [Planctomycetota bacterium]